MRRELFKLLQINPEGWSETPFVNVFVYPKLGVSTQLRAQLCSEYVICNKVVNGNIEGIVLEVKR